VSWDGGLASSEHGGLRTTRVLWCSIVAIPSTISDLIDEGSDVVFKFDRRFCDGQMMVAPGAGLFDRHCPLWCGERTREPALLEPASSIADFSARQAGERSSDPSMKLVSLRFSYK